MSNFDPEPPQPSNSRILAFDEFIAIGVALSAIGLLLFWALARRTPLADSLLNAANNAEIASTYLSGDEDVVVDDGAEADSERSRSEALSIWIAQLIGQSSLSTDGNLHPLAINPDTITAASNALPSDGPDQPVTTPYLPTDVEGNNPPTDGTDTPPAPSTADNLPNLPTDNSQIFEPGLPIEFSDVPSDYWAANFIDALTSRQIMAGYNDGTFRPETPVTRAEIASQIAAIFQTQGRQDAPPFADVPSDYWASRDIQVAVETGFMKGYPEGDFQPQQVVPRMQVLVAIATGLGLDRPSDAEAIVNRYDDADTIPDWAIGQIAAATQAGLVVNYPDLNQLQPEQPATRAEVAAIMSRALIFTGQMEDHTSEYVVE